MIKRTPRKGLAGIVAIVITAILTVTTISFLYALSKSTWSDVAAAVGAILGGLVGAIGAAAAVYLTITIQHDEEANRTKSAVLREVVKFCRFAIQNLGTCAEASRLDDPMALNEFLSSMENPQPIVYPAIADRLGLTNSPQEIVSFYARFREIDGYVKAARPFLGSRMKTAEAADVNLIGETLVEVLSLGKKIIEANDENNECSIEDSIPHQILRQMNYAIKWGSEQFS